MKNIDDQIQILQAGLRRQKMITTLLLVLLVGVNLTGASQPEGDATFDLVRCKALAVVDDAAKSRIMASTVEGNAGLVLTDKDGKGRLALSVLSNGASKINLRDQSGVDRFLISIAPDGTASFESKDPDEVRRFVIGSTKDRAHGVIWLDRNAKPWLRAASQADGTFVFPTKDDK